MKEISSKVLSLSTVLLIAILFIMNLNGSADGFVVYSSIERNDELNIGISIPPVSLANQDSSSDEMKHITASVEAVIIEPLISGKIFPNTPVDFVIETTGPTPEVVKLYLDSNEPSLNLTYDLAKAVITTSDDLNGLVSVDTERSSTIFNSTSKKWEITFNLNFDWSYPKDFPKEIRADLTDVYGGFDSMVVNDAYIFEPDLMITGEPTYTVDDPSSVTDDGYIRGGMDILIQQINVHFEGAPEVSPLPSDITVGIKDSKDRFWEYIPINRAQLNSVEFSLPIPKEDGPNTFEFGIYGSPPGANTEGRARFQFNIDTTAPSVTDFRSQIENDDIEMSWAFLEEGSGLDGSTLQYSIHTNEMVHVPWTHVTNPAIKDGRLLIHVTDLTGDDLEVKLRMADRVGNDHSSDQTFLITMDPVPAHDISIDDIISNPDLILINQMIGFSAMVHNHGTEDERSLQVEVLRNNEIVTYVEIPELPAGSSREIRWTWRAVEGTAEFKVIVDPQNRINDDHPEDNHVEFIIEPEYLDIKAKEDYLVPSDPDAENTELITLSFSIRSIGSIESGPIKVTFSQDGKYMGLYQVPSIYKEGSRELVVDWKVDTSARNLTLMIDPYNEVLESIEDNNQVHFENPFYQTIDSETPETPQEDVQSDEAHEPNVIVEEDVKDQESGGTIFNGPEIEREDGGEQTTPTIPIVVQPIPEDPEVLPPFIIPTAGFVIGTSFLGLALFGLRSEIFRFKLLGLLIPLYSKIKKSKIEKGIRHEIMGYLKAKPGANYSELKRNLDLNDGSLVHHLRILEREEKVYSKKMGKYKLFYVSSYRRQASIRDYISPFQLRIVEIILQNPGIVPKKLSRILDRSQTDMSYHLSELSRNGLLDKKKKGRNIHYYIADEYSDILV